MSLIPLTILLFNSHIAFLDFTFDLNTNSSSTNIFFYHLSAQ